MHRRNFLAGSLLLAARPAGAQPAIAEPHFPSRLHQFVWRNWELANTGRMARLVGGTEAQVLELGASLGLPPKRTLSEEQLRRMYITVIRQNWHLLPEAQIIELLGWTRERFAFTLKEDDFLDIKLGPKPPCEPLRYRAPSPEEKRRAAEIRNLVRKEFGAALGERGEDLAQFVAAYAKPVTRQLKPRPENAVWDPRIVYSFFALYGDPLLEPDIDPFPDEYLAQLADIGVNAVWMQAVLNTLAPSKTFPEFGKDCEKRFQTLGKLIQRTSRFGIKIFFYLNEPRAMPAEFFAKRRELRGAEHRGLYSLCTSTPAVRDWIYDSLRHVTKQAPGLGGYFTISASENHTNCYSHVKPWSQTAERVKDCPRCAQKDAWEVLADLHRAMREGINAAGFRNVRLIAWDWGWTYDTCEKIIPLLPKDVAVMSISEWDQPVHRGGVRTQVKEYSLSVPGPGPRALKNWAAARRHGLKAMAKLQISNTWEMSAVPYVPVPPLVVEHGERLSQAGISGVLASWTCGGYPSPNLEAMLSFAHAGHPGKDEILRRVAERRYGAAVAADVVQAWRAFSQAFQEFPYGVAIYVIPVQHGPANLLRLEPTGHRAAMMLFPHDALPQWCGAYPPEAVAQQFTKMAARWREALPAFRKAMARASGPHAPLDLAIAETCYHHFQSVANQVRFYMLRGKTDAAAKREMAALARQEIELAKGQYRLSRAHSILGYEGTNHYYYTPLDLVEKVLNAHQVIRQIG
jgi:hypothetical protein